MDEESERVYRRSDGSYQRGEAIAGVLRYVFAPEHALFHARKLEDFGLGPVMYWRTT